MDPRAARLWAVGLACALAVALAARFALEQGRVSRQAPRDPVGDWLAAVGRLPPLPESATVGFVTTVEPDQWEARLFLTRYALAPRLVLPGSDAPWVVGHFDSRGEAETAAQAAGSSIAAGTPEGLFLLGRQPR